MRNINYYILLGMSVILLSLFSCQKEEEVVSQPEAPDLNPELVQMLAELRFNVYGIQKEWIKHPVTGEGQEYFIVENDLMFTEQQIREMIALERGASEEQYRTTNLVSKPRNIKIHGYSGGSSSSSLTSTMIQGLQMAVANYNAKNLDITFTLTTGTAYTGKDIVVYKETGAGGGRAGFPSSGNPYHTIFVQSGTANYGLDVLEHVMTHEIGHCIGFRHTDWFNRSISCGSGGSESTTYGAVHIPGTPSTSNIDMSSVMLSCFNGSETGEFSYYDGVALNQLYGTVQPAFSVSPTSLGFSTSGGCQTVSVTATGSWTAGTIDYWLTVTPTSGSGNGSFSVCADYNLDGGDPCYGGSGFRFGTIVVTNGSQSKTISVSQAGTTNQFQSPYDPIEKPCY